MKVHERLKKAQEVLAYKAPWFVTHILGRVILSDTGVAFGNEGDFATPAEMKEIIAWLVDEFDYKTAAKSVKKTTKKSK